MALKANFSEAEAFLAVANCQSFGLAARELGITQSTVSRRIASLEARVGMRLIERTTRRVTLTSAGLAYAEEMKKILQSFENAAARLQNDANDPAGLLRVTMPTSLGRARILPCIRHLAARYPKLRFELDLSDRYVDLWDDAFDLAIRLKSPQDSGIDAVQVGSYEAVLCAAPAYLAACGQPDNPADIARHRFLAFKTYAPRVSWSGQWGGEAIQLQVHPFLTVNDALGLRNLTLDGAGIAVLPTYLVAEDLKAGALVNVLPALNFTEGKIFVALPRKSRGLEKVRVFVDAVKTALA
jgi:DNA-binding transcriptional LysR family regulator